MIVSILATFYNLHSSVCTIMAIFCIISHKIVVFIETISKLQVGSYHKYHFELETEYRTIVLSYVTLAISWTFIREVIFVILLSPTVMHSYIFVPVYTWIFQRWYIFRYNFFYEMCSTVHGSKPFPHLKVFWRLSVYID